MAHSDSHIAAILCANAAAIRNPHRATYCLPEQPSDYTTEHHTVAAASYATKC